MNEVKGQTHWGVSLWFKFEEFDSMNRVEKGNNNVKYELIGINTNRAKKEKDECTMKFYFTKGKLLANFN